LTDIILVYTSRTATHETDNMLLLYFEVLAYSWLREGAK